MADSSRPWFKKKRFIIPLAFVVLGFIGQSGKASGLTATDYRDAGFFDEETNTYYWGAYFKINSLDPWTKVNCHLKGLDANGKVLIEEDYVGNTLNDHTIIKYGSKRLSETTKEIQEGIKSFDAVCKEK